MGKKKSCTPEITFLDLIRREFNMDEYQIGQISDDEAFLRLLAEVEKLKKQMSANSTTLPLNIECFMNDKDVTGEMKRTDMEALAGHLFQRVEITLRQCLEESVMSQEQEVLQIA
ncbi:hypothetical protein NQ318_002089 [Aromia moschata]|uniref:Uncharacterized protein n=1 Tax=Aromia moschata TaxID=1265417 RepID=A0AAV8X4D9_9CUCU|nr:hypothetical protein NQ318_002089 [Aromia moschata]